MIASCDEHIGSDDDVFRQRVENESFRFGILSEPG